LDVTPQKEKESSKGKVRKVGKYVVFGKQFLMDSSVGRETLECEWDRSEIP
jgi:hypothetical protein